ncbi:MAG: hypothetical protein C4329_09080 [Chitinophagaceae bacterium]
MPAVNEIFIQHNAAKTGAILTISTQDCRVVKTIAAQTGIMQTRIDLASLQSGLYFVKYDDGTAEILKVVKL